jgi:DNA-binding transcriptional ArsR family regulator
MRSSVISQNATYLKALGNTKRLEIVCLLHGHELTVNQVAQMTALRQATVSQHLMLLKKISLVRTSKIGKEVYYSLTEDHFMSLSLFIDSLTKVKPMEDAQPTVIDPICQMKLTPHSASFTTEYDGVRHYFCGKGCLKEFNLEHKGAL